MNEQTIATFAPAFLPMLNLTVGNFGKANFQTPQCAYFEGRLGHGSISFGNHVGGAFQVWGAWVIQALARFLAMIS